MNIVEKITLKFQETNFQYIINLEKIIFNLKLNFFDQNLLLIDIEDQEPAQRYFYLHTLPILEGLGIFKDQENSIFWGAIQLCLDLHLRYVDYIIDDDKINNSRLLITQKSYNYLLKAQMLLNSKGYLWTSEQMTIYLQYFDYENEVNNGQFHDFGSLWRRVSPLFIISGSYLKSSYQVAEFDFYYKRYISCLLLKADCGDIIKDIAKQKTPITSLLYEYDSQIDKNIFLMAKTINSLELTIAQTFIQIKNYIGYYLPIWTMIIEELLKLQ